MWRSFFMVCALTAGGAMGAAAAQGEGTFESPRQLSDSVVVTANRFGLPLKQSVWPAAVIDLGRDHTVTPALETRLEGEAGLDIRSYNGVGSLATLSSWGVFNRHMLLLYNGRVVKDYSLGGFNLSDFSAAELQRVEVVKGPQSAFYGSDAVGGVVNLISKSALADRISATTRFGSFDFQDVTVDAARRFGSVGLAAWGQYTTTDNRRDNAGVERILAGVRSEYLTGDHRLSLSARYFEDSLGSPGPVPDPNFIPVYGSADASSLNARQEDDHYSVDLQYRYFNESLGEARIDLFWEKKNLQYNSLYNYQSWYTVVDSSVTPPDSMPAVDSVDVYSGTTYNKRSAGITARFMKETGPLSIAGGVDFLSGSLRATGTDSAVATNIQGPFAPFDYAYDTYSFWSARQDQVDLWGATGWQIVDKIRADLSGRIQLVKDRSAQPSYNLGLVYSPNEFARFKLGYAYAFRLPTLAEQFADDVYTAGNINLNPETARTLLGTVSLEPGDHVSVSWTVFHQQIDSLIQYRYDFDLFRSIPRNYERFRSYGYDVKFRARLNEQVTLQWNGVYQQADQSTEQGGSMSDAPYVPDLKWRTDLNWVRGPVDACLNLTYTSARSIVLYDGRKDIAQVYELGARVGVQINDYLRLSAAGYDLTDERRPDQFGFVRADRDYPGLGRRFLLEAVVAVP